MNAAVEPAAAKQPKTSRVAWVLLVAMVVLLPWPFYLIAVLSITPIPVLVLSAVAQVAGGILAFSVAGLVASVQGLFFSVLVLPQAALGAWVFHRIARSVARRIEASPAPVPLTIAVLAAIAGVTFLPLYGGGENMASGGKTHNLYVEMMHTMGKVAPEDFEKFEKMERAARLRRSPVSEPPPPSTEALAKAAAESPRPATLEGLGQPQLRIEPDAPVAITFTPEQLECMKTGKSSAECGVVITPRPRQRVAP